MSYKPLFAHFFNHPFDAHLGAGKALARCLLREIGEKTYDKKDG
jgi:hypothetical protein